MSREGFKVWKGETKVFMAIERTMIGWLRFAGTIGIGAFAVNVLGQGEVKGLTGALGAVQAVAAVVIAAGAYLRYRQRIGLVQARFHGTFGDPVMPALAGCMILTLLAGVVGVGYQRWSNFTFRGGECARLPFPMVHDSKPPYMYVTMHGSNQPVNAYCTPEYGVSGVHRFTLPDMNYAGPATDQHSALVHMPRGMTRSHKLLFVVDGSAMDSSIAVFGECPGRGTTQQRPFLGRIRAEDEDVALNFAHPYGITTTSKGDLLVSTQNGGAVVGINFAAAGMEVVQKVAKPWTPALEHTGPLRDLAVDSNNCAHVADRTGSVVRHYCPFDGPLVASTQVRDPIGLAIDDATGRLFIGSYGCIEEKSKLCDAPSEIQVFQLPKDASNFHTAMIDRFSHSHLLHPAGMIVHEQHLYVLEQSAKSLLDFTIKPNTNATFSRVAIEKLPDDPEQLLVVHDEC